MLVLVGHTCQVLGRRVAELSGAQLVRYSEKRFPDSSYYARVDDPSSVRGEDVCVIHSCITDENIIETLVLQEMLRESGAGRIISVVPYFGGYARQDRVFLPGEPVSARAMARTFSIYTDLFITVDAHSDLVMKHFDIPAYDLSPAAPMAEYLGTCGVEHMVAPDEGARRRAESVAKLLRVPCSVLKKRRIDSYTVEMTSEDLDVEGKVAAIVDDSISTGGTIIRASQILRENGAERVVAACTNGLFGIFHRDVIPHLKEYGVACTDTIQTELSYISVAGVISDALRRC